MGEVTDVDECKSFVQMRMQGAGVKQCIHFRMDIYSLCMSFRDCLGYLVCISRTDFGACCGVNDWASRAEPLSASAVGERA